MIQCSGFTVAILLKYSYSGSTVKRMRKQVMIFHSEETTDSLLAVTSVQQVTYRICIKIMDIDRVAEEIRANMITLTLINPEFDFPPLHRKLRNMCDYARRLKESKLKIVATDGMIRRVRTGEIDLKHLKKEAAANKQRNRRSQREFVKKLEHLAKLSEPKVSQPTQPQNQNNASEGERAGEAAGETAGEADGKVEGEAGGKVESETMAAGEGSSCMEPTEDQKAILLLNKKKETETSRKEASMLMEIIFGKRMTREHIELLQRENQKNKASPYGH